mgnify:CR=1 FL=1
MARKLDELVSEALDLPTTSRAELAKQLLESLVNLSESEIVKPWSEEAERRTKLTRQERSKLYRPTKSSLVYVRGRSEAGCISRAGGSRAQGAGQLLQIGEPVTKKVRKLRVQDFPFNVIYVEAPSVSVVLTIAPHTRRPNYWRARVRLVR